MFLSVLHLDLYPRSSTKAVLMKRTMMRRSFSMDSPVYNDRYISRLLYPENEEDLDLDDWSPPGDDLCVKMVSQIEQYLSDANLAKDAFLLKHVRRNKMGYVNIKLLTSFKKMKHLTKDWRITAYALQHHSSKLELNEEGNKVRRRDPVPESLLAQVPSRLLLVWNLSDLPPGGEEDVAAPRRSAMETAISLLEPYGRLCTVRVTRPGRELPPEVQRYSYRYPELSSQESVLVEFEDLEGAGRAYNQLSEAGGSVKGVLVGRTSQKKAGLEVGAGAEERGGGKGVAIVNRRMEQLHWRCGGGDDSSACSSSESEVAASCSPLHIPRFSKGQVCTSPWNSPRSSPRMLHAAPPRASPLLASEMWKSPDTSPELSRRHRETLADGVSTVAANGNPWVHRRRLVASSLEGGSSGRQGRLGAKRVLTGDALPPGLVRLPYGPDGTRGFLCSLEGRRLQCAFKL